MFRIARYAGAIASMVLAVLALPSLAQNTEFKDVPPDHWAAEAVKEVVAKGIMKGFPDGTFRGEQPVTRYELAVTLARFMRQVEESLKELKARTPKVSIAVPVRPQHWAFKDLQFLISRGYVSGESPLLRDLSKPADPDTVSAVLAQAVIGLVERYTISPEDLEIPEAGPPYRMD
ncbi:MAG: S-layer homology domain-containing protein [Armatimonadota bacterium]|nr:S-layer homology domain-containing protein [bacterium]MDW8322005.1 S-layer homology domain-containing protein [Armatimonadota bacterium]